MAGTNRGLLIASQSWRVNVFSARMFLLPKITPLPREFWLGQ